MKKIKSLKKNEYININIRYILRYNNTNNTEITLKKLNNFFYRFYYGKKRIEFFN